MLRRLALTVTFASMGVIGLGYASAFLPGGPPPFVPYAFAVATSAVMGAVVVLGVIREGSRLGALGWLFGLLFVVLAGGFCAALALPAPAAGDRLWLGLPAGAALIVYVVAMVPLLLLPLAYARTFERTTLGDAELDTLRRQLREMNTPPSPDASGEVNP